MDNNFNVDKLGKCAVKSPFNLSHNYEEGDDLFDYIEDDERILYEKTIKCFNKYKETGEEPVSFEKAGPREFLFFEPAKTKAAIVTCGGLCPGLNNVIRSIVHELYYRYRVNKVIGIRYGFEGFIPKYNHPYDELTPESVDNIHMLGGTVLGSSRGNQNIEDIVDSLVNMNINILFCIGGDGTLKGANEIYKEITKRNLKIAVAGIPKTIDNDIMFIEKSFGFETAVSKAHSILKDAHNEAKGAYNGIALVKLMGRDSGFIAAHAALSTQEVNFVIVPEMKEFGLYGVRGFLRVLKKRLVERHHAMIVVAEGAGQHLFEDSSVEKDASGNIKHKDIGILLKDRITEFFNDQNFPFSIKYIDPSYIIRSAPANASDSKFCSQLAQNAVHGAMAGKTGFVVGIWNYNFTYLPIESTVKQRNKIDMNSELWWNVLEATGQPVKMKNEHLFTVSPQNNLNPKTNN
ncbi:MAG: ATP-dependent 6-phosphofructokinase [Bacteroidota bacterium]|nr:ATP-dependent 6-phosphofructokinase [Bacteroidota bacterium]